MVATVLSDHAYQISADTRTRRHSGRARRRCSRVDGRRELVHMYADGTVRLKGYRFDVEEARVVKREAKTREAF
jgi:hypothetical protein